MSSEPLRGARRVTAKRIAESWSSAVPVTLHRDLDVSSVVGRKARSPGIADLLLAGLVHALHIHPALNGTFEDGIHRTYASVNIGYAVDTPRGLVVPVLRELQDQSIGQISEQRRAAVARVLVWKHSAEDLIGGTFTVSNLGAFGVDHFDPIVSRPQIGILGIGRVRCQTLSWYPDPVPVARWLVPVSLTIDHRVIDGAGAGRFLTTLQEYLLATTNPAAPAT